MKKHIDGVPFCTHRHYNCLYVVLDSLLRFYECEPSVPCFANWDFVYCREEGERFAIQGRITPLSKTLKAFGIALFNRSANDGQSAWDEVKKLIDVDIPVAINLDVFPLAQAGLYPRLRHSDHQFIAAGYDDEAAIVHLIDPSPWQPSAQSVPLELFLASWNMSAIVREGQDCYNWFWLEVPRRGLVLQPGAARTLLQRNLRSMSASNGQANITVGLEGIEQLAGDSGAWIEYEEQFLKARLGRCSQLLLEIALLREGHGRFLRHVAQVCQLPCLDDLSREFESISQGWFVVKNLCFKGAVREATSVLPRIQSRLCTLARRERTVLATLAEVTGE